MAQGNALDREAAAKYLRGANSALNEVNSAAGSIVDQLEKINNLFAAPNADAPVSQTYRKFYDGMNQYMNTLYQNLSVFFPAMEAEINAGSEATGDHQNIPIDIPSWSKNGEVIFKKEAGIESFQSVASELSAMQGLASNYTNACNEVINNLKGVYSSAGTHDGLMNNAHQAAEAIRVFTENIQKALDEFKVSFGGAAEAILSKVQTYTEQDSQAVDAMYSALNGLDFTLLQASDTMVS